jgi:hypothetical protein
VLPSAEHENRRFHFGRAQGLEHGKAIHARQHAIEHDHVELAVGGQEQPVTPVGGAVHGKAFFGKAARNIVPDLGIVFNQQDASGHKQLP